MNKRSFIKSLVSFGLLSLVPSRLFADSASAHVHVPEYTKENVKSVLGENISTINGAPVVVDKLGISYKPTIIKSELGIMASFGGTYVIALVLRTPISCDISEMLDISVRTEELFYVDRINARCEVTYISRDVNLVTTLALKTRHIDIVYNNISNDI